MRTLVTNLTNVLDVDSNANISTLREKIDTLTECYANTSILLEQFKVLLNSCPEKGLNADYEPDFDAIFSESPIVRCYKNSDEWRDLYDRVKSMASTVCKQKNALNKISNNVPKKIGQNMGDLISISQAHIDVTNDAKINLETIHNEINMVLQQHQFKLKCIVDTDYISKHPILRSIDNLSLYLKETITHVEKQDKHNESPMEDKSNELISQTEDLIATMLLIIQSIYKKHLPQEKSSDNIDVLNAIDEIIDNVKEESKEILEDKHLKELLQEKLSSDSKMLQLDALINKTNNLLVNYVHYIATNRNTEELSNVVMRVIPILEQTVLFVQYFITQKVAVHRVSCKMLSVLLKIFSDLATKG